MTCTYYTYVCTYWHLLSMYFSTHYKNRNWNLLWEFYSFLSFEIRILDLAFNIWSYHFSPILVLDLFQSLSFSSYPRNFFRIDLMKKKNIILYYFFLPHWKRILSLYQKIEKTISNFDSEWTLQFIQRGVPDFLLRRCW